MYNSKLDNPTSISVSVPNVTVYIEHPILAITVCIDSLLRVTDDCLVIYISLQVRTVYGCRSCIHLLHCSLPSSSGPLCDVWHAEGKCGEDRSEQLPSPPYWPPSTPTSDCCTQGCIIQSWYTSMSISGSLLMCCFSVSKCELKGCLCHLTPCA